MVNLIKILSLIAFVLYGWGVVNACRFSYQGSPQLMSPVIGFIVSSMTPVFATNLGAVVGIGVLPSNVFKRSPFAVFKSKLSKAEHVVSLQILVCYFYMICVVGALVVWGLLDFSEDPLKIVLLLPELVKSLIGVGLGAVAAWLGVKVVKRHLKSAQLVTLQTEAKTASSQSDAS